MGNVDPGAGPFSANSVSGIGDFDARLLALPYASSKMILAAGFDGVYLDIIDAYEYFEGQT